MRCEMCGYIFERGRQGCKSCFMGHVCGKVRCPRCGLEVTLPEEKEVRLSDLAQGSSGIISRLDLQSKNLKKLLAFGLLPGTRIHLRRSFPCLILKAGNSDLALDKEVSSAIYVYPESTGDFHGTLDEKESVAFR